jgi:hypothetical protein
VDLFDVVRACFRRWYVVVPLLLVTYHYAHNAYASAKPEYYTSAVVGLAPPSRDQYTPAGNLVPKNGLLDAGGPNLIANMAVLRMREPSIVNGVVAAGGRPDYGVKMFPVPATMGELPLVMIDAGEPDPNSATKTVDLAAAQADAALQAVQQQAGVPDDQMVRGFVVSPPSEPVEAMPTRTRSTIVIFAAGAGAAILVAVLVDVVLLRWKAWRRNRRQIESQAVDAANSIDATHPSEGTSKVPSNADGTSKVPSNADGTSKVPSNAHGTSKVPSNAHAAAEIQLDSS